MTRTQIQLPEPLFRQLKRIAGERDWSLAELVRRGMEAYAQTCPELTEPRKQWTMPVLRASGGHLVEPSEICAEAEAVEK